MKNNLYKFILVFALFLSVAIAGSVFAEDTFSVSLKYGNTGPEVVKLQNFLIGQGLLDSSLATGNFLSLTQKAVMSFQTNNGIINTGYFGPLSRAAANSIVALSETPKSTVSMVSVTPDTNSAGLILSNSKRVAWRTTNYPTNVGIDINLLRKTSDNPASYVLVEKIAKDTINDGVETWVPKSGQDTSDLYIEVTCSTAQQIKTSCVASGAPIKVF